MRTGARLRPTLVDVHGPLGGDEVEPSCFSISWRIPSNLRSLSPTLSRNSFHILSRRAWCAASIPGLAGGEEARRASYVDKDFDARAFTSMRSRMRTWPWTISETNLGS